MALVNHPHRGPHSAMHAMYNPNNPVPEQESPSVYYNKTAYEPNYSEIPDIGNPNESPEVGSEFEMTPFESEHQVVAVESPKKQPNAGYTDLQNLPPTPTRRSCCRTTIDIIFGVSLVAVIAVLLLSIFGSKS